MEYGYTTSTNRPRPPVCSRTLQLSCVSAAQPERVDDDDEASVTTSVYSHTRAMSMIPTVQLQSEGGGQISASARKLKSSVSLGKALRQIITKHSRRTKEDKKKEKGKQQGGHVYTSRMSMDISSGRCCQIVRLTSISALC